MKQINLYGKYIAINVDHDIPATRLDINSIAGYTSDTDYDNNFVIKLFTLKDDEFSVLITWYFEKETDRNKALFELDTIMSVYFQRKIIEDK